jgi:ribonuclease H2 subunit B
MSTGFLFLYYRFLADGQLLTMTPIDPTFLLLPIMQAIQPVRLNLISICHQNNLVFMKLDGSTPQFRTADDILEEAAKRLRKPPAVDSSSTETNDTLVLSQDIMDLWSLKCIRKAIRSICDIKGLSSGRNQPFRILSYILFRHFGRHCRVSLFA